MYLTILALINLSIFNWEFYCFLTFLQMFGVQTSSILGQQSNSIIFTNFPNSKGNEQEAGQSRASEKKAKVSLKLFLQLLKAQQLDFGKAKSSKILFCRNLENGRQGWVRRSIPTMQPSLDHCVLNQDSIRRFLIIIW